MSRALRSPFVHLVALALGFGAGPALAGPAVYDAASKSFHFNYTFAPAPVGRGIEAIGDVQAPTSEQETRIRAVFAGASRILEKITGGRARIGSLDFVHDVRDADIIVSPTGHPSTAGMADLAAIEGRPGHALFHYQTLMAANEADRDAVVAHDLCHYIFGLADEYEPLYPGGCPARTGPGCLMDNCLSDGPRGGWMGRLCNAAEHNHQPAQVRSCQEVVDAFFAQRGVSVPSPTAVEPVRLVGGQRTRLIVKLEGYYFRDLSPDENLTLQDRRDMLRNHGLGLYRAYIKTNEGDLRDSEKNDLGAIVKGILSSPSPPQESSPSPPPTRPPSPPGRDRHLVLLSGALAVTILVVSGIGAALAWPPFLRGLVRAEPTHLLGSLALKAPQLRRRLYAPYAEAVAAELERARAKARSERYVVVPARLDPPFGDGRPDGMVDDPAGEVTRRIGAPEVGDRPDVLIESPGGRGKSALFREILRLSIDRFRADPRAPLPILIGARGEPLRRVEQVIGLAREALGPHLVAGRSFETQLASGGFFLAIDDLRDTGITPELLKEFLGGSRPASRGARLLLSTRPDDRYREAFEQGSRRPMRVEPQRLDETTLESFVSAYGARSGPGTAPAGLSPEVKQACRAPDGTYLPILVRLALLAGGDGVGSVPEIYRAAFGKLLRASGGPEDQRDWLREAARFCVATYWRTGDRGFAYAYETGERKALLRRLKDAGIVIPMDETSGRLGAVEPLEVRFFHDSMQSFLTALGLFEGQGHRADEVLRRAAGDPLFAGAQSDLVTQGGSELFQMCLHFCRPIEALARTMREHLRAWSLEHHDVLSVRAIREALPDGLGETLSVAPDRGAGAVLLDAVALCERAGPPRALSRLYARIAPLIWREEAEPGLPSEGQARPLELFFSYAHEDERYLRALEKHLSLLRRFGLIRPWHDRRIVPSAEWGGQIDRHLETADLILMLVSADFLGSDYIADVELKRALARHAARAARVVPVILRPCEWQKSELGKLQALPTDGRPIATWRDQDEAFTEVARGIHTLILDVTAAG